MKRTIIVSRTGAARAIHDPVTHQLLSTLGTPEIRRASNVEPTAELSDKAVESLLRRQQPPLDQYPAELVTTPYLLARLRQRLPSAWWADCLPSGGPVLGPFADRDTALHEEVAWLQANHIPTPRARTGLRQPVPMPPLLCSCGYGDCEPGYLLCPECVERDTRERVSCDIKEAAEPTVAPVRYSVQIEPVTAPVLLAKDLLH